MCRRLTALTPGCLLALLASAGMARAAESIEFVAEHLPEIAMDNRYASLPIWNACDDAHPHACMGVAAGYARTHAGTLSIDGPMLALAATRSFGDRGSLTVFGFFDDLALAGGTESRPLDVLFANPPLALPAPARFTGLDGSARDQGLGLAFNRGANLRWLPAFDWSAGVLWQRVTLHDYSFSYVLTGGPDTGARGTLDYDARYTHVTPFLGAALPRTRGAWRFSPHVQLAMPLPRRGMAGHVTGPAFDLRGDSAQNGHGKHFGDPSITFGLDFTYLPWNLTVDAGSTITQLAFEPLIHEGVKHDLLLSARWAF